MKYCLYLFFFWGIMNVSGGTIAEWKFQDGRGSTVFADSSGNGLDGRIEALQRGCRWASDDFEGNFLQFDGTAAECARVKHDDRLNLSKSFHLEVVFSADLSKTGKTGFMAVACKGKAYKDQWAFMVRKDGSLMFYLAGLPRPYKLLSYRIESNREYRIGLSRSNGKLLLYVNNELVETLEFAGDAAFGAHDLLLGGIEGYPFAGTLKYLKLSDTPAALGGEGAENASPTAAGGKIVHHPESIFRRDFSKLTPAGAVGRTLGIGQYYINNRLLEKCPSTTDLPTLEFDPQLTGNYHLYVGVVKRVNIDNGLLVKTSGMDEFRRIELPPNMGGDPNVDVLFAADVRMDGQKIRIGAISDRYTIIRYFKFVPAAAESVTKLHESVSLQQGRVHGRLTEERISRGLFRELHYRADDAEMTVSGDDRESGAAIWSGSWMRLVFPSDKPPAAAPDTAVNIQAAKGQGICFSFAARGLTELTALNAASTVVLTNREGRTISGSLGFARSLRKRFSGHRNGGEFMQVPVYVEPVRPLALAAGETRWFWGNVTVPEDAVPGIYSGEIRLENNGRAIRRIPVSLEVYPFVLDKLANSSQGFFTQLIDHNAPCPDTLAVMRDTGLNSLMPFVFFRTGVKVAERNGKIELKTKSSFYDKAFRAFAGSGMTGKFYIHWGAHCEVADFLKKLPLDSPQYEDAVSQIGGQLIEQAVKCGVKREQLVFYIYDEVVSRPEQLDRTLRDASILKKTGITLATSHLWRKTHRQEHEKKVAAIYALMDEVILRYSGKPIWYVEPWREIEQAAARDGKTLMQYNFTNGLAFPELETMRFASGWFYRTLGKKTAGALLWHYDTPRLNPRDDLDAQSTDWVYIYPPEGEDRGGPALMLEAMREGISDLRYVEMLERLADRVPPEEAAKARKLLDEIAGSVRVDEISGQCTFLESSWARTGVNADGSKFVSGLFALPGGWDFALYDANRERIAREIIRLLAFCR